MNDRIGIFGGIFALLVFWHFVVDWLFQSHDEAMRKSTDPYVRAIHCAIYTGGFAPVIGYLGLSFWESMLCGVVLFVSHFIEDTYIPVLLWVKHVRRPPEFSNGELSDKEAFVRWASTPLGKVIAIVVDQLVHVAFLMPMAYFATNR